MDDLHRIYTNYHIHSQSPCLQSRMQNKFSPLKRDMDTWAYFRMNTVIANRACNLNYLSCLAFFGGIVCLVTAL